MIERHRSFGPQHDLPETRPPVRAEVDPARRRTFTTFSAVVLGAGVLASVLTSS